MKQWLKDYFTFNKQERNGILVLLLLVLMAMVATLALRLMDAPTVADHKEFEEKVMAFTEALEEQKAQANKEAENYRSEKYPDEPSLNEKQKTKEPELFPFDPNTVSKGELTRLGLSEKQADVFLRFRESGAKFFEKEDFKKAYTIGEEDYQRLKDYIVIASIDTAQAKQTSGFSQKKYPKKDFKKERVKLHIDLNKADSVELTRLYGIGPSFSSRIIKYRELLGGFHSESQLLEVYGMDSTRFAGIEEEVYVKNPKVKRINVNTATIDSLKRHPYIYYRVAKSIVNYRDMHGNYAALEEIKKSHLVNDELYLKIAPYLTTD